MQPDPILWRYISFEVINIDVNDGNEMDLIDGFK